MKTNPRHTHALRWQDTNALWLFSEQKAKRAAVSANASRYVKERRKVDVEFKIMCNLRGRIRAALGGLGKSKKTREILGCGRLKFINHLRRQFAPGMTWENYGQWHIDHIRPCSSFDLTDPSQQEECFNYMNLQPLWAADNFKKSDTWNSLETR
jgi:hypothetical protein